MGLVKYGAGIIQISGSIAGTVHARNRFGNYIRPRTKPVNPNSTRQAAIRALLSYLAEYWHDTLTAVQRGNWDAYAAAVTWTNRLGEAVHLTGFNMFCRANSAMVTGGLPLIAAAPTILSLMDKDYTLACSAEGVVAQTLTFTCSTAGWAGGDDNKLAIALYMGVPQLSTRNFFNGPWRFMDIIDAAEGAAGTGTYAAPFAFAVGQKVFLQARVISETARLSGLYQIEPKIIEADA